MDQTSIHDAREEALSSPSPGNPGIRITDDCRSFILRRAEMKHVYIVKKKDTGVVAIALPDTFSQDLDDVASREWVNCCVREYLERMRLFKKRFSSRGQFFIYLLLLTIIFVAAMWAVWPLWGFLIDVEADAYYKELGVPSSATPQEIKKAYRGLVKRWHPDHNPACGEKCRSQMHKIQQAHDALLSRGDLRFELANRYHEELSQLRSLFFFRIYQLSDKASAGLCLLLLTASEWIAVDKLYLSLISKVITLLIITLHEILFVSGFNIVLLAHLLYSCIVMAKSSAQERLIESERKESYYDALYEGFLLLGGLIVFNFISLHLESKEITTEDAFRAAFGCLYVLAFLYSFTPNIYDNFVMRKCAIPITFFDGRSFRFSWKIFIWREIGFLVDDLFVFSCHIPSCYRIIVHIVHFVFLCQFFLLPWDAPVRKRRFRKTSSRNSRQIHSANDSCEAPMETISRSVVGGEEETSDTPAPSVINGDDELVVSGLDDEAVQWLDVAVVKYHSLLRAASARIHSKRGEPSRNIHMASTSDLQYVSIFAMRGGESSMPSSSPTIEILLKVQDPVMSELIAREQGPQLLMPSQPNTRWDLDTARLEYRRALGPMCALTTSTLRRGKWSSAMTSCNALWGVLAVSTFFCAVVALFLLCISPTPVELLTSTRGLSGSLRPYESARFSEFLPRDHVINTRSVGLLTSTNWAICTLDLKDVVWNNGLAA